MALTSTTTARRGTRARLTSAPIVLVTAVAAVAVTLAVTSIGDAGRASASTSARAATEVVRFHVPPEHPERWFVELTGAQAHEHGALAVYAGDDEGLPPMIGRYEAGDGGSLRFVPRFAPAPGVTYIARAAGAVESRFALPVSRSAAPAQTRVTAIYPTMDRVPANLLKLYIEFSAPMRDGEAEQHLHLLDARGREMPRAFLHVDAELWNDTHTRLTVLFDPGRIKRGLRANLEDGAPLSEGQTVRLAIDPAWRDGHAVPLASGFERTIAVGPADRTSPDWHRWIVAAPRAGTRDAVTVRFDEPLDRALLDRWLMVTDLAGTPIAGHASVGANQTSWSFIPEHTWRGDRHQVLVDPRLEDVAGNSLTSLFDADADAGADAANAAAGTSRQPRRDAASPIALPFSPNPMS